MAIFIKIGDIKGESTDDRFKDWFEVHSYSFGATNSGGANAGGGGGGGRVSMQDLIFTKSSGAGSPSLFLHCCNGKHIRESTLVVTKPGDQREYLMYQLEDVLVSGYSAGGDAGSLPVENISLNFTKISYSQNVLGKDGTVKGVESMSWDLKTNKGG